MPRQNLIQENTFEESTLQQAIHGYQDLQHDVNAPWSRSLAKAPVGRTGQVLRFELRKTDAEVSSSQRTEITYGNFAPGSEQWFGGSVFLENWAPDDGGESILQWHGNRANCPPLALLMYSDEISIMSCPSDAISTRYFTVGSVKEWNNKWVDVVVHVKWATNATGTLEVWINGVKKVSKINNYVTASENSYMKLGMNKWGWEFGGTAPKRIFYWDDFRVGNAAATYADVAPDNGTTPPPTTSTTTTTTKKPTTSTTTTTTQKPVVKTIVSATSTVVNGAIQVALTYSDGSTQILK
jgi:hypothetical protein